ncbi:MAG: hypothetical protein C0418_03170 [Coriobacteriaceae bacterium]|nr:hypothetical protein [Coriobacteriaceae bacterium]
MSGFAAFLAKEFTEIRRTWRIWVVPGILIFVGLTSPVLAKLTPALIGSITAGQPGFVIEIPDPVPADAVAQWVKNLTQMVLIAEIVAAAGLVSGERRRGTTILVLTKPVSRDAFVLAKWVSEMALVTVATLVAAAGCYLVTLAVFGTAPLGLFVETTALWLVLAAFFDALVFALSVWTGSTAAAAGIGIGGYFLVSALTVWAPARAMTPAGLLVAVTAAPSGQGFPVTFALPVTLVLTAGLLLLAVALFRRQEL